MSKAMTVAEWGVIIPTPPATVRELLERLRALHAEHAHPGYMIDCRQCMVYLV